MENESRITSRICGKCKRPESADNMTCCEVCNVWMHFGCADIADTIAGSNHGWKCEGCRSNSESPDRRDREKSGISRCSSAASRRSQRLKLSLKLLEEQRAMKKKQALEEEEIRKRRVAEEDTYLKRKFELLMLLEDDVDISSKSSETSAISSREKVKQWIEKKVEFGLEVTKIPDTFQWSDHSNQSQASSQIGARGVEATSASETQSVPKSLREFPQSSFNPTSLAPINNNRESVPTTTHPQKIYTSYGITKSASVEEVFQNKFVEGSQNLADLGTNGVYQSAHIGIPEIINHASANDTRSKPNYDMEKEFDHYQSPKVRPQYAQSAADNMRPVNNSNWFGNAPPQVPTTSQLAARQVLTRELPIFSGNPEDWPIFFSSFKNTNEVCGYNDAENLARLQRCLRGHALESVRSRLLLPASVQQVMETLHRLFGRPEILINTLLKKLRNVPSPKADNLNSIITFGLAVQNLVDHIVITEQHAHLWNPMLLQEIIEKLPTSVKMQWGYFKQTQTNVNLATFKEFMTNLVNLASDLTINEVYPSNSMMSSMNEKRKQREKLFVHSREPLQIKEQKHVLTEKNGTPTRTCSYCDNPNHRILNCPEFQALDIDSRWKAVRQRNLCRTCLVPHRKWPCRSKKECGQEGCRIRHHALLHNAQKSSSHSYLTPMDNDRTVYQNHHSNHSYTLFRYIPVTIYGKGKQIDIFAFLDEGSSSTLLEAEIAECLGIEGPASSLTLAWTSKVTREEKDSLRISITISGKQFSKKYAIENVQTVRGLELPKQTMNYDMLAKQYPHLRGLPIKSYNDVKPQMIIGLEHVRLLAVLKLREGNGFGPTAVKTRLGWCAFGRQSGTERTVEHLNVHSEISNQHLHELMKQYFLVEESMVNCKPEAESDKRAIEILERTVKRNEDHFEAGLLWKYDDPVFPSSLSMAMKRLASLERRLSRDPELRNKMKHQLEQYQLKGYAHKASKKELDTDIRRVWYLPLGVVTNPKKPGKIRLVWDAAAKVNGESFNDMLLKGPDLLTSLPSVLTRFRQRNIAVCGDICEMFHQIKIREEDKQFQRFLWRDNSTDPIQVFIMDVATFGATCSPCIAQFVKNKNANAYATSYPRAVQGIVENHYVDDFLDSTDTVQEAIQLVREVRYIHAAAGFEISRFLSNSSEVLKCLGESDNGSVKTMNLDKQVESERVLGLMWVPSSDVFTFDTTARADIRELIETRVRPTKRQVLRTVMTLFDPLGFIAHFIVQGKVLMQNIWRSGTDWDEPIDERLMDQWYRWSETLEQLSDVKVPRSFFQSTNFHTTTNIQLHIFVDASEIAYSCVGYLRLDDGIKIQCALVAAKTKVAPLKPLSIPRLELQAAMIGARLAQTISQTLTISVDRRFLWSDSATVLAWLRSDSRKYHQFVAFRIGEILSLTSISEWRHVPSRMNVADDATKWGTSSCFDPENRWFSGPDFLYKPECCWPSGVKEVSVTSEELRTVFIHHIKIMDPLVDVARFSNWNRLLRATGYVIRAINIMQKTVTKNEEIFLQSEELQQAEVTLWRQVQAQVYADDVAELSVNSSRTIKKSSPLYKLSPFLDEMGVIRMGSRIGAAPLTPYEAKYPIILPKIHPITVLLTDSYHRRFLHANGETVLNEMRQRFYIPGLRMLIRKVTRDCQYCKVKKIKPQPPKMAPLPKIRLTPFIRPFTYVGVDYFGPLEVKVGRSIAKRWAVLFTCLTVRAVHMEVAHSLSSQSCIMAFRRFIARRGAPVEVYTDNGTNFVGASRQLTQELLQCKIIAKDCAATFTNAHTAWYFNPPAAPHMGGAWERMVRSIKTAMKAISEHTRHPSDEVLETVFLEAEAIVNSRPLTYVPLETADQEALTPNHFLLYGSSGIKQPMTAPIQDGNTLRDSWKLAQWMVDEFWRKWMREYLPMITRRTKWFDNVKPIEPGDLVMVVDTNSRNSWERGRVVATTKGADGQTRRATVQTTKGTIIRPATKLALLDVGITRGAESSIVAKSTGVLHGPGIVDVQ